MAPVAYIQVFCVEASCRWQMLSMVEARHGSRVVAAAWPLVHCNASGAVSGLGGVVLCVDCVQKGVTGFLSAVFAVAQSGGDCAAAYVLTSALQCSSRTA
jgi:hypothetical protein